MLLIIPDLCRTPFELGAIKIFKIDIAIVVLVKALGVDSCESLEVYRTRGKKYSVKYFV